MTTINGLPAVQNTNTAPVATKPAAPKNDTVKKAVLATVAVTAVAVGGAWALGAFEPSPEPPKPTPPKVTPWYNGGLVVNVSENETVSKAVSYGVEALIALFAVYKIGKHCINGWSRGVAGKAEVGTSGTTGHIPAVTPVKGGFYARQCFNWTGFCGPRK